ncbi:MAG: ribosome small subunit-dependent GTPase A [Flavobacteriales bacterium]|nr:ribosome small subunit-dependent GTPase A [Flavobacteriales bacterium]
MQEGLVIKSTGKWCEVRQENGEIIDCQIKGKFRLAGIKTTNPIAVGDRVGFEIDVDGTGVISVIHDRQNYIIRKSVNLSKQAHIVASNIDHAFLIVTLAQPPTSTGFIDRFLVTADAYGVPVTIVFNKIDVYDEKAKTTQAELTQIYEDAGYAIAESVASEGTGVDALAEAMKGKINMVSGHSGVGKSTLINQLIPDADIRTAEVSEYHLKGRHTTTFAEMHELPSGGFIIDTPGIKGFGLVDLPKEELHHHFPEMFALLPECKFNNCLHINEPGCAVKQAVENREVSISRYENYLMMYHEDEGPYR